MLAFFGPENVATLNGHYDLKNSWSEKEFEWNDAFKRVMAIDEFLSILPSLKFYTKYDNKLADIKPIWHSSPILNHLTKNIASVAVTVSIISMDEISVTISSRYVAKTYMKSKVIKFGTHFYVTTYWNDNEVFFWSKTGLLTKRMSLDRCNTVERLEN